LKDLEIEFHFIEQNQKHHKIKIFYYCLPDYALNIINNAGNDSSFKKDYIFPNWKKRIEGKQISKANLSSRFNQHIKI
jgi:hypothetical protein